ncbi:noncanonical pyrimidine nucleotidase, YjjG family protein [Enterococcus florum]|uniref:Noncanonical pyrimidine nucleotidase, YjjG family protein n=1 Tax=Enterococcus florum TaxID=2480627 RepID=A0A4P5PCT1_9ENTE|nr:YjjG family noncanonical pyrimidine nucleotidase [Enterococcus florum]GCF94101.1 noncanonical pyrimidine nucleotidase, YjjG family protein [Enterococcus florum]
MGYTTVLFDIDDTLLDFKDAEAQALNKLFQELGLPDDPNQKLEYKEMNRGLWQQHEAGLLSREELLATRFSRFFERYNKQVDGPATEARYRYYLNQGHKRIEHALELVQRLSQSKDLYVVTNGVSVTQRQRLHQSGLAPFFKKLFISEELGVHKPMREFFEIVFKEIPQINKKETVIIGDSLTSDIQGGVTAGIDTIWMNPTGKKAEVIQPTYQIQRLTDLYGILEDF